MPADAEAPPDLATPLTAMPGLLGGARQLFELGDRRQFAVDQVEIGNVARQFALVGEPGVFVFRRHPRHRHRALGERRDVVGRHVIGGNHRLPFAHQHAQAQVVTLGALGFFHRAVAHLDRQRHGAHRHRVGGIGAGLARGLNQPFGAVEEGGLVEQGFGGRVHDSGFHFREFY